ncbi:cytochrome c oxidase subunit II [Natronobacterium gregoryi]|uniref:Cytochrome C oxidase subunit II n=2 Tax=Natronobacterium gregoryi TaxID=44930 RepID=L0ABX8_NATGS|nr:cytochrome c oxidase subunit II [Natronobacterium gregoryi]AFZ71403.1 cytochrome c oxidase, subunit II [Natronobacterium gregoryi SP2]ELY66928.1 cytochrome C oxidase subunit II [Natronobacterium gregoryi SP2]PLK21218.1 cytochrome c oxidase subunit II [Natronobacterium gregoryi SP2]SFI84527.1 cytochrome c oxidase subunit 2 [Natronobacterium gregoryi]
MEVLPHGTRVDVFENIFLVFLGLGTLVGIVVIAYTLYNAYKYRDTEERDDAEEDLPSVGELPTGGKGGKKLFLSFGLSAIIVISLVVWTYGMLLYVEDPGLDNPNDDALEIEIEGFAFDWNYYYENGLETSSVGSGDGMVIPADTPIMIDVTATDVWHTFGISDLRVKADAKPGEHSETWFVAEEPGTYTAECFELCGPGHSDMDSPVEVMPQDEYDAWVDEQLTMTITLEDEAEERITDGFELALEHQENDEFDDDLSVTYSDDEFENGSITIGEIEQGGPYDLAITFEDDEYEEIEETVSFTGPVDETYTVEDPDADDEDDEGEDEDEDEEEPDNDTEDADDTNDDTTEDGGDDE